MTKKNYKKKKSKRQKLRPDGVIKLISRIYNHANNILRLVDISRNFLHGK